MHLTFWSSCYRNTCINMLFYHKNKSPDSSDSRYPDITLPLVLYVLTRSMSSGSKLTDQPLHNPIRREKLDRVFKFRIYLKKNKFIISKGKKIKYINNKNLFYYHNQTIKIVIKLEKITNQTADWFRLVEIFFFFYTRLFLILRLTADNGKDDYDMMKKYQILANTQTADSTANILHTHYK